jgi:adenylate cyclase
MAFAAERLLQEADRRTLAAELDQAERAGRLSVSDLQGGLAFELNKLADRLRRAADADATEALAWSGALSGLLQDAGGQVGIERVVGQLATVAAQLRPHVAERVCLVGMTATSAALDQKPTPLERATPGVFAHAAIVQNLLDGRFVTEAGLPAIAALVVALGLAVTLAAARLPAVRATLAGLAIVAAYTAAAWAMLRFRGLLLPVAGPWLGGAASLMAVMVYRELTEGRNRRWITGVFKQYTSDKLVDQLVANPELLVLGGQRRDMTVYFSDIAGFTTLSERLDPQQLVAFLQAYLEEMTDRLLEQGATLDKYEGDAVLAFFGAPLPQEDHARRCLAAAVAHLRALPRLDDRLHREGLLPADHPLRMRVGISSGPMVVGNFGSTRRFDYTVIGDAVNIGARLEGANRQFGTTVLVSDATRQLAGDGQFLLRRIGPIRVVGRAEPIVVHELLDGDAPGARDGLDDYAAALGEFESGWLHEARAGFESALAARPGDGPTRAYLDRIDALIRDGLSGAPGPWDLVTK